MGLPHTIQRGWGRLAVSDRVRSNIISLSRSDMIERPGGPAMRQEANPMRDVFPTATLIGEECAMRGRRRDFVPADDAHAAGPRLTSHRRRPRTATRPAPGYRAADRTCHRRRNRSGLRLARVPPVSPTRATPHGSRTLFALEGSA